MPNKKPPTSAPVTAWLPNDLLARLDAHLAARCAGAPGVRPSRQAWIIEAVKVALSNAESPALAAHRGRLVEATVLYAAEEVPHD